MSRFDTASEDRLVDAKAQAELARIALDGRRFDHQVEMDYAIVGGFHLAGALFEPIIPQTVEALQQINPAVIVPAHCTGWRATQRIAQTLPEAYTLNSVGTTFKLMAD